MDLLGTLTRADGTSRIELTHTFRTSAADLWNVITDPERLGRWFAPVRLPGDGTYLIVFDDAEPDSRTWGEIQRCDAPEHLAISWTSPGDETPSHVTAHITATDDGAQLTLVHAGLAEGSDLGHTAGWEVYLHLLDRFAAGEDVSDADWSAEWTAYRDAHARLLGE